MKQEMVMKESDGVLKFEGEKSASFLITHPKIYLTQGDQQ